MAFLPTIITSPLETYRSNLPMFADVIEDLNRDCGSPSTLPRGSILGIHLEGPFISSEPGAVGCHPPEYTRVPSIAELQEWQKLARGHIKLITIAAELEGAELLCRVAVQDLGIAVSLGHQMASSGDIKRLVQAGASLCTHLGNGMPNMIHRHKNILWTCLADDRLSAMLITDGEHLPADAITAFVRAKGSERIIITSDVAPVAGLQTGVYQWGKTMVRVEGTKVHAAKLPCLAGSGSLMLHCMNYLASIRCAPQSSSVQAKWLVSQEGLLQVGFFNPLNAIGATPNDINKLMERDGMVRFDSKLRKFERV